MSRVLPRNILCGASTNKREKDATKLKEPSGNRFVIRHPGLLPLVHGGYKLLKGSGFRLANAGIGRPSKSAVSHVSPCI